MEIYLKDLANQIKKAKSIASGVKLPDTFVKRPDKVLFCGMGGSAISGDILGTIAQSRSQIHWTVNRTARLPQWVDFKTIVILSSYSGNTHEVEFIFKQAVARKAHFLLVASGGGWRKKHFSERFPFSDFPRDIRRDLRLGTEPLRFFFFLYGIGGFP